MHARWCPRGSRKGALREQLPHPYTADGPGCRAVSSRRCRGPKEDEAAEEAAPLALRTREGSNTYIRARGGVGGGGQAPAPLRSDAKVPLRSGLCDMNDISTATVCVGHQVPGGHHPSCSKKKKKSMTCHSHARDRSRLMFAAECR